MRIELQSDEKNDNKKQEEYIIPPKEDSLSQKEELKKTFKSLSFKGKLGFIWDYYKWFFIVGIAAIVVISVFVRDYISNNKPTYLYAQILNSNFAYDATNTLEEDYIDQFGIDTEEYHLYIDYSVNLSEEAFDTAMLAGQTKLVSLFQAGDLDVVMGPVGIMEGPADCNGYGNLMEILPQDLIDELIDREYEFYYYDQEKVLKKQAEEGGYEVDLDETEILEPYVAGIYLDNCSYLNNNGEYGCYDLTTDEDKRPIFTICYNAPHMEHAIDFLRFLIQNR